MKAYAELHCHTTFSDGLATPEQCIRQAARQHLQVLAITDHNAAAGGLAYKSSSLQDGILVISGEEVSTNLGHVLALFVRQTIPPGPFERVIAQIREQDALAFMAHPYHIPLGNSWRKKPTFKLNVDHLAQLDGIESVNGHNRTQANRMAQVLAAENGLAAISGSDAHLQWEIGNARTILDIPDLTCTAVKQALRQGLMQPMPRRFNAYGIYLGIGLLNRLIGRNYAWREPL